MNQNIRFLKPSLAGITAVTPVFVSCFAWSFVNYTSKNAVGPEIQRMGLLLLFLLCAPFLFPQQQITLPDRIKEKIINSNTGMLLVRTSKELYGIHPQSQSIQWTGPTLEGVDFSSYKEVPFTPLAIFEGKPLVNSKLLSNTLKTKGVSRAILNVVNGKVLFNSVEKGFSAVSNSLMIPEKRAFLISGIKDKKMVVSLYAYENGNTLWENDISQDDFFKNFKGTLFDKEQIVMDRNYDLFWLKNNALVKLSGSSGEIVARLENVRSITLNTTKDILYVVSGGVKVDKLKQEREIRAYDTKTMHAQWEAPTKITGAVREIAFDTEKLVVITSRGFDIIDASGQKKWAQTTPLPLIKKIVPVTKGYLVVQEKYLTLVDSDGEMVWDSPIKIALSNNEQPVYVFKNATSALVISPSLGNKVSIADGMKLWDEVVLDKSGFVQRNLKLSHFGHRIWYDAESQQYPVFSDNRFYIFNIRAEETPKAVYEFDFGRALPDLKIRDSGYFLQHQNTCYLLDRTGTLIYKKEYPPSRNSNVFNETVGFVKRGLGTYAAVLGFVYNQANETFKSVLVTQNVGFLTGTAAGIYSSYQLYQNPADVVTNIDSLGFDSGLEHIFRRIKKRKEDNEYVIIMVPEEDATSNLIRLHIDSGSEKVIRKIDKKQSDFLIDPVEGILYSFSKNQIQLEKL